MSTFIIFSQLIKIRTHLFLSLILYFFQHNLLYAQTTLLGLNSIGGNQFGTIVSIPPGSSTPSQVSKFTGTEGSFPLYTQCLQASNGKLYGVTYGGGQNGYGILFEYDIISNMYINKYTFGFNQGGLPAGSLIEVTPGKLYGMTSIGGDNNLGVIFEYDYLLNTYQKKISLDNANGSKPYGSLLKASNGKLYGMTSEGGTNNCGVIFEYDWTTNAYATKVNFSTTIGYLPFGSLTEALNGKLYGLTYAGGVTDEGTLFEYNFNTNTHTLKRSMSASDGKFPYGSLTLATNGMLYGLTTEGGGVSDMGSLFEYNYTSNIFTKKHNLESASGAIAYGSLLNASNGKLYGLTNQGGANNTGTLFEYNPTSNLYIKKIDLTISTGYYSSTSCMQASNGKIYGLTSDGGGIGLNGVLFEYDLINNSYTKKVQFNANSAGSSPLGGMTKTTSGKLFGIAYSGGLHGLGAIFQYNYASNSITKKIDLDSINGSSPYTAMIEATNGKLYGLTYQGGANNVGTLFEYNATTNVYTKKLDLSYTLGAFPFTSLLQAANGKIYGLITSGGNFSGGVIFEYDYLTNVYTKKYDFQGSTDGANPYGALIEVTPGKLYGTTRNGGNYAKGTIFEYDYISETYTKKIDLQTSTGGSPRGSLCMAGNGILYGVTRDGGAYNAGTLFEYNSTSNIYTKKFDFSFSSGYNPLGTLMEASNGKLYGTTYRGGLYAQGVVFEYDYGNNIYSMQVHLNALTGGGPAYDKLIEINTTKPYIKSIGPTMFCSGNTVTLTATPGSNYIWNTGATTQSIIVSTTGVYSVTVNGISASNDVWVVVTPNPIPTITASGPTTFCNGDSVILSCSPAANYLWSNGSTNQSITVSTSGNYSVQVTNMGECSATSSAITVTVSPSPCNRILNLTLFLEGYYIGSNTMTPAMYNQSFNGSPLPTLNDVDDIIVELHDTLSPYPIVAIDTVRLQTNGQASCTFPLLTNAYYIVVKHRNSIATWSQYPVSFSMSPTYYNFSLSAAQAYGANMIDLENGFGVYALFSGDINQDENIDLGDFSLLELDINNFEFGYKSTDINGDGSVDLQDVPLLELNSNLFIFSNHP